MKSVDEDVYLKLKQAEDNAEINKVHYTSDEIIESLRECLNKIDDNDKKQFK